MKGLFFLAVLILLLLIIQTTWKDIQSHSPSFFQVEQTSEANSDDCAK